MRVLRWLCLCFLIGSITFVARPRAAGPQAVFHAGIPGGFVRDATKVGSVIYGVGTWANSGAGGRIDGALWTIDVTTNTVTRTALPDFCITGNPGCGASLAAGEAITPDGAYVASQARSTGNGPTAVRVTRSSLLNVNLTPNPPFTGANNPKRALGISDDGSIVYGIANTLGIAGASRAVRFDVGSGTNTVMYPQPAQDASGFTIGQALAARGVSSDGSVAVGQSFTSAPVTDSRAWRYVFSAGTGTVTDIPRLPGGTWNSPFALADNGNFVALVGDSTTFPNREVYTFNASTSQVVSLGSPNEPWSFTTGGITNDGRVVAVTAAGCGTPDCRHAFFHNDNGWFYLASALVQAQVDLSGWTHLQIFGMNGTGTLVWGSGFHNGAQEGFVAEFEPDYLKNFNPQPVAPSDTSIVGAWAIGDFPVDPSNPGGVIAFLADGTYFDIEPDGFERGFYTFDGATLRVMTLVDTNGDSGLSDDNGGARNLSVSGDEIRTPAGCVPGTVDCGFATRINGVAGSLVGGWVAGDPSQQNSSALFVFTSSGKYFAAQDGLADGGGHDGIEIGTVTWSLLNGTFSAQSVAITTDTNGDWGLSAPIGAIRATLDPNELTMQAGDDSGTQPVSRVIDPATVAQVTGGAVQGTLGTPFAYQVNALRAQGYGASGLPAGLGIDSLTGMITGTPLEVGFFPVTVFATNTFGNPRTAPLNVTIASAVVTSTGTGVPVTPDVPPDTPPVTMTFDTVTTGGTTTVAVLDSTTAPPPPSGFQLGDTPLIYEIQTTATFAGPVTICFSYAGVDFGGQTPRLFHYVNGAWVDITSSVDSVTQTLCGTTTSFSPFGLFTSPTPFVKGTGFYSPVSPLAGFVNTSKAGSTVPLKFNVYVNGVEKTDTDGLQFAFKTVSCTLAPEDPVDYATQENSGLRYDTTGQQFILNWKTPKSPGCYVARVTNADGLLLSATFKLK